MCIYQGEDGGVDIIDINENKVINKEIIETIIYIEISKIDFLSLPVDDLADLYDIFGSIFQKVGISTYKRDEYFYARFTSVSSHVEDIDDNNVKNNKDEKNDTENIDENKILKNDHDIVDDDIKQLKRKLADPIINPDSSYDVLDDATAKKRKISGTKIDHDNTKIDQDNTKIDQDDTKINHDNNENNMNIDIDEIDMNVDYNKNNMNTDNNEKNIEIDDEDDFQRLRLWFTNHISTALDYDCDIVKKSIMRCCRQLTVWIKNGKKKILRRDNFIDGGGNINNKNDYIDDKNGINGRNSNGNDNNASDVVFNDVDKNKNNNDNDSDNILLKNNDDIKTNIDIKIYNDMDHIQFNMNIKEFILEIRKNYMRSDVFENQKRNNENNLSDLPAKRKRRKNEKNKEISESDLYYDNDLTKLKPLLIFDLNKVLVFRKPFRAEFVVRPYAVQVIQI